MRRCNLKQNYKLILISPSQIKKLCLIDDHISNVRAATSLTDEDDEFNAKVILFTGGGRASLNCYLLNVDKTRVVCMAS